MELTAHTMTALVAVGIGISVVAADRHSKTSWCVGGFLACIGASIDLNVSMVTGYTPESPPPWAMITGLTEVGAFFFGAEWLLRVRKTIPAGDLQTRAGDLGLRIAQGLAAVYGVLSVVFSELRFRAFVNGLGGDGFAIEPGFFLFAAPLGVAILLTGFSIVLTLRRKPDQAESVRLLAFAFAAPLFALGLVLPLEVTPLTTVLAEVVFLIGTVEYYVLQGERAQFLRQFLSPQVAEMVRRKGLQGAMEETTREISLVFVDLRSFSALSEEIPSRDVMRILERYYDAVGEVATEFGGTIKDHAGDGLLILVGAPIPYADHARRAVELAGRIRERVAQTLAERNTSRTTLAVGVGVASGPVTVGVISGATRLEYVAVGAAVNLASRLCDHAGPGEILVDRRTVELLDDGDVRPPFEARSPIQLKGFSEAVPSFALGAA